MKRVFAVLGFSLSVCLIVLNLINPKYILIISIGLVLLLSASLLLNKYREALVLPLCISSCLLACFLMLFNLYSVAHPQLALDGETVDIAFYATDTPKVAADGSKVFDAKIVSLNKENAPQNINVIMYAKTDCKITPYEVMTARAELSSFCDKAFDSKGYWADRVFLFANAEAVNYTDIKIKNASSLMFRARENIANRFISSIDGDNGALAVALITGDKSYISYETKEAFSLAGASHIMAISGLHLSVAAGSVMFVLKKLRASKQIQGAAGIAVCLLYMALAGFTGSVTRAGIMLIVMSLGLVFSKRSDALNSLGLAVFLMCLNPFTVCDVGTALSVTAVLSLLTVYPHFKIPYSPKDPYNLTVRERFASVFVKWISGFFISLVIVLCTMPVMYIFFGYVSIAAPITNLVIVPLGSLSMTLSAMGTFIDLSFAINFVNSLIIGFVKWFVSVGGGVVGLLSPSHIGLALAGAFLIFALFFFGWDRFSLKPCISIALSLVLAVSVLDFAYMKNTALLYFAEKGAYVINYKGYTIVGEVDDASDYRQVKAFLRSNRWDIDYLTVDNNTCYYSLLLADSVNTNRLIAYELNDDIINSDAYQKIEEYNKFNLRLAEDFKMYYNFGTVSYDIKSVSFSVGTNNGDIVLNGDKVYDSKGTVSLSRGEVLYLIENKNTFSSGRINQWQK